MNPAHMQKVVQIDKKLFHIRQEVSELQRYFYGRIQRHDNLLSTTTCNLLKHNSSDVKTERIITNKLSEITGLLVLAQQNLEDIQKLFIASLKKDGKLLDNLSDNSESNE